METEKMGEKKWQRHGGGVGALGGAGGEAMKSNSQPTPLGVKNDINQG